MLLTVAMLVSGSVFASETVFEALSAMNRHVVADQAHTMGLEWKKGDRNEYKMNAAMGMIQGSMIMEVREITAEGIWVDQSVDAGAMGKQQSSTLFDKDTGAIKKIISDGKEQEIPKSNIEVIETKEDKITVPAGTFECIHARLKDKDANQEVNIWANPAAIPLSGMLKMVRPFQFGEIQIELTKFTKN